MRGEHRESGPRYSVRWMWVALRSRPQAWPFLCGLALDRWKHRHCDTTDFHHQLGCRITMTDAEFYGPSR